MNPIQETNIELLDLFEDALERKLKPLETQILQDIILSGEESRIVFLEMMKQLVNKHKTY
ncbi:hypothetical protein [Peribacillus acanthi]|uniref:hypothetical protein n=1 Tax=Peribacillus acanthi TaxID=2171554 RepID=UPI000D3E4639|nr:hypothetical protein [Peribacillus acanthi]